MKPAAALLAGLAVIAAASSPARADDRVDELERKIDALSQEVERLKLSGAAPGGGALSKLSLGGYGEIDGQFPSRSNQRGDAGGQAKTIDLARFVLLGEYGFTDALSLRFELEIEHGGTGQGAERRGEFGVEQAYLDYRQAPWLAARAGHLLVPMGLVNLRHEPPFFHGVRRPSVETLVIPSTWHENGAGFAGRAGVLDYQAYAVSGLQATASASPSADGFLGSSAVRGGRTEGTLSPGASIAWTGRLDAKPWEGALVGVSGYAGLASPGLASARVPVSLWDGHASWDWRGAEVRALYVEGRIGDAGNVDAAQKAADPTFVDFAGSRFFGGYLQAAFDVLTLRPSQSQYLAPFFRYERYDTASRAPGGFTGNPATSRVEYVIGLTYKPVPKVALKADQQWLRNEARTGVNQWDVGIGWVF